MKTLGFNPGHHGSVCVLEDGEIKYFIQEERINKKKYDAHPFIAFMDTLNNHKIDWITWASTSIEFASNSHFDHPYWCLIAAKFNKYSKYTDYSNQHHTSHCAHAFYNSGFKQSIGIVIDGIGSSYFDHKNDCIGSETETAYYCSYPNNFKVLFKNINLPDSINLSRIYETVTMHLGWDRNEAGKTMGLAPYGKFNPNIPNFFKNDIGDPKVFFFDQEKVLYTQHSTDNDMLYDKTKDPIKIEGIHTFINEDDNPQLKLQRDPREWHYDESKITDLEKDLAWKVQNDTQQLVGDYIEKAIQKTGIKQVCCSGGYFLNCVTNYYLVKRFPDIEFYFEPLANDAGTAIGSAKIQWHFENQDDTIRPLKSLYLGKQYSKDELLEGIKKYT
jgi:carbamoyltransferase